jgi:predicted transcriptional regulator
MRKSKGMIGVRVDDELRARIEEAAAVERRPVSNLIRNVLSEYLDAIASRDARAAHVEG